MNIIIVGGGTAGWSAAYGFTTSYGEWCGKPNRFNVTFITDSNIPSIGVGESTLPTINKFHNKFGGLHPENYNWVKKCNGTAKKGNVLNNFKRGREWFVPFHVSGDSIALIYDEYMGKPYIEDYFDRHCTLKNNEPIPPLIYHGSIAYHFDASKYQQVLKDFVLSRSNLTHIESGVNEVILNEEGGVKSLLLKNGNEISADLYIDCTGFNSVIRSKMPGSDWNSFSDTLLTNNAIVYSLPYINKEIQQNNKTIATAADAGWIWTIPLENCVRYGYVHSTNHVCEGCAEKELRQFIRKDQGYKESHFDNLDFQAEAKFKTGAVSEFWHKNVLAVGLSSSFIEPLGSQGLHLFQETIMEAYDLLVKREMLNDLAKDTKYSDIDLTKTPRFRALPNVPYSFEGEISLFNDNESKSVYTMKESIEMFYRLSDGVDTQFWRDIRQPLTESQQELVDFCRQDTPNNLLEKYNKYGKEKPLFQPIDLISFINFFKG